MWLIKKRKWTKKHKQWICYKFEIVWIEWSIIFETLFANFEVLVWRLKYLAKQDSPNMVWENIYKFVNVGISTTYHEKTL